MSVETDYCSPDSEIDAENGAETLDSSAMIGALDDYHNAASRERVDLVEHAQRVNGLVQAYASDLMPDSYDAIMMHDVVSRFRNSRNQYCHETRQAAANMLLKYFTDPRVPGDKARYVRNVLSDFDEIEVAAGNHRRDLAKDAVNAANGSLRKHYQMVVDVISNRYEGEIPDKIWKISEARIAPDRMKELLANANIESVIIKACELLDNLQHPVSLRKSALLQDVLEAESFYAPLCEVLGLEALGSALMGQTKLIRLEKLRKFDTINQAKALMSGVQMVGADRILRDAFAANTNPEDSEYDVSQVVGLDYDGKRPANVGEFAYYVQDGARGSDRRVAAGNWRMKSTGSLADKLERYEGGVPADLYGAMVISKDLQSSTEDFAAFVQSILARVETPGSEQAASENSPKLELNVARGKKSAVYVQGTREYVEAVLNQLRAAGIDESLVQTKIQSEAAIKTDGYKKLEVSKIMFALTYDHPYSPHEKITVPVEVQFFTKLERRRSRIGEVAHIIYKYIDSKLKKEGFYDMPDSDPRKQELREWARRERESFVGVLADIYDRMSRLNPNSYDVNGQSDEGGDNLFEELMKFDEEYSIAG